MDTRKRIVVIGGGTGTYTILSGLKRRKEWSLSAIVTMSDDGGHTGELRDNLGVLPPGDLRQCLVALSNDQDDTWRRLFSHRFADGSGNMTGQSVGNIILSALEKIHGNPISALQTAHRLLNVRGQVIPVTLEATKLCAELTDGHTIVGEHLIDDADGPRASIQRCFLENAVHANPEAVAEIQNADLVILGPGDFWTSLVPNLIVPGITDALTSLQRAGGKILFVCNLVTKKGQTDDYTASTFASKLDEIISPVRIDEILLNSRPPSPEIIERYREEGEHLVRDDLDPRDRRVLRKPIISGDISIAASGDKLRRSLLRHDPDGLAHAVSLILQEEG